MGGPVTCLSLALLNNTEQTRFRFVTLPPLLLLLLLLVLSLPMQLAKLREKALLLGVAKGNLVSKQQH
jgi:hypothetical protein